MPTEGPTSHSYFSQRLRLRYVDWGNEDAPPMLLVHGGRDHCRNWDWVAQAFRDEYHIIAPDLRGHGDSQWTLGGSYHLIDYVYDIAQLMHQRQHAPATIIGHSLGGTISLMYGGLFPEAAAKLISIEGWEPPPKLIEAYFRQPMTDRLLAWVEGLRHAAGRLPRRYPSLEEAYVRMQEANPHLSERQARHLTIHGSNQNEDGTYSWKFDNYVRMFPPVGLSLEELRALHQRIRCPTLLVRGTESWAADPNEGSLAKTFQNVQVEEVRGAGHWVHHDKLDRFLEIARAFLAD